MSFHIPQITGNAWWDEGLWTPEEWAFSVKLIRRNDCKEKSECLWIYAVYVYFISLLGLYKDVLLIAYIILWHVNPLLGDMPRWRHTALGVGEYHVTSTFPPVTSLTLSLRPLFTNVALKNLPCNNMWRCVFSVVRAEGLSWRQLERLKQLAVSKFSKWMPDAPII
jgi:hypothetical protein